MANICDAGELRNPNPIYMDLDFEVRRRSVYSAHIYARGIFWAYTRLSVHELRSLLVLHINVRTRARRVRRRRRRHHHRGAHGEVVVVDAERLGARGRRVEQKLVEGFDDGFVGGGAQQRGGEPRPAATPAPGRGQPARCRREVGGARGGRRRSQGGDASEQTKQQHTEMLGVGGAARRRAGGARRQQRGGGGGAVGLQQREQGVE